MMFSAFRCISMLKTSGFQQITIVCLVWVCVNANTKRQTNKGLRCFQCHEATSPIDCNQWAICGQGEICFTQEFTNLKGEQGFHMGCEQQTRCDLYRNAQSILGLLGRRDTEEDGPAAPKAPCYRCCSGEDCNAQLCTEVLANQAGMGNSVSGIHSEVTFRSPDLACPPTYITGPNSCYYIANWGVTWDQARLDCKRRAADLVSVNSQEEHAFLVKELALMNTTYYNSAGYWTGGYYVMATKEWNWVDLTKANFTYWGPGQPSSTRYPYDYRVAMANPVTNKAYTGWAWINAASGNKYGFICETGFLV